MTYVGTKLGFTLLRSTLAALRGFPTFQLRGGHSVTELSPFAFFEDLARAGLKGRGARGNF